MSYLPTASNEAQKVDFRFNAFTLYATVISLLFGLD